jgi:GcrA cell cycle regulator
MSWTEERIERLKAMWTQGATASQIADELGGVSRNAVIGKAHRLGLEARPSPVKPGEEKTGKAADAPAPPSPSTDLPFAVDDEDADATGPAVVRATTRPAISAVLEAAAPMPPAAPTEPQRPQPMKLDPNMVYRSVGPGGFIRQGPGDTQAPIPPAPPRRLVPAKPNAEVKNKTGLLELNDRICKWPLGHPGEPDFHFCGQPSNPGFPYCVAHCGIAYQAQLPRRDRRPPPPLPFGGPRVR